jgi:hypothetical protein
MKATTDDIFSVFSLRRPVTWEPGYHGEILEVIRNLMLHMTRSHTKVFLTRIDIYYHDDLTGVPPDKNETMSRFCEAFGLYGEQHHVDIKYLWVREISHLTGKSHYHLLLLIDGHGISDTRNVWLKVLELWRNGAEEGNNCRNVYLRRPGGEDNQKGGIMIHRDYPGLRDTLERSFQWLSYMAQRCNKKDSTMHIYGQGHSHLPAGILAF